MSLIELVITYSIDLVFWLWVVRWGGAERLEGTFSSGFLVHLFAPGWSADGIKLFCYVAIFLSTILFITGIFLRISGLSFEDGKIQHLTALDAWDGCTYTWKLKRLCKWYRAPSSSTLKGHFLI